MGAFVRVGPEMTWPFPGKRLAEVEWALRYGEPTRSDLLVAASVISAYEALVLDPQRKRQMVVRELRRAVASELQEEPR